MIVLFFFKEICVRSCCLSTADASGVPEAVTPDLSDVVSACDAGQDSILADYGDGSEDQCDFGK